MEEPVFRWHLNTINGKNFNVLCTQWLPQKPLLQISDDLFTQSECDEMAAEVKVIENTLAEIGDKMTAQGVRRQCMTKIRR